MERVEWYLNKYGAITGLQALRDLGIMRLPARIFEINEERRSKGLPEIEKETVPITNRWNETTRIAKYRLPEGPLQSEMF